MDFWKQTGNLQQDKNTMNCSIKRSKLQSNRWKVGLSIGLLFLVIGFYQEQFVDIYHKAIMICLECIGIG